MPPTLPSHQGLIAPLWRRWPGRFHVLGLCVGAAVPDVVDGLAGLARGHLGQWYGHSLAGLFALCLPLGLALTWAAVAAGQSLTSHAVAPPLAWLGRRVQLADNLPRGASRARRIAFVALSVLIGAFSHLFFDFISHGNFYWLYPWYEDPEFFPSWWYATWAELPVPGYRDPYPVGPHFLAWTVLGVAGIVMFFRPARRSGRHRGS